MSAIYPGRYLSTEQRAIADRIDPNRYIALRPIRIVGPLAFYWSLGKKGHEIRTCGARVVMTPRVRWIGRATKTLT